MRVLTERLSVSTRTVFGQFSGPYSIVLKQEIITVREKIPHIGPLTKVIPLNLFLDIVPSSSEDATCPMRGQPKRLT